MRIVFASSEVAPFCRTGGLGDVVGSLPAALAATGEVEVATFLPLHRAARRQLEQAGRSLRDTEFNVAVPLHGRPVAGRIRELVDPGPLRTFFVDAPRYFEREGLYGHGDDPIRYAFFSRAVPLAAHALLGPPDVLHAHDWMTALLPTYLRHRLRDRLPQTRSVFTIHNLAYQGWVSKDLLEALDLDWSLFHVGHLEFHDQLNLMKGAIVDCDAVTTVSPTYAREILTPAFGQHLGGHLAQHQQKLRGILNGLDVDSWDPATDAALPATYSADDIEGKWSCRRALLAAFGLDVDHDEPVLGVVSRFTPQKGLDLMLEAAPALARDGVKLVVLGTGDPHLEGGFRQLASAHPGSVGVRVAFDDALARLVVAGSDLLAIPSRFEPCGLTQLQAMRYGTIPVVRATGGLRDTVHDPGDGGLIAGRGHGFCFEDATADALLGAVRRAAAFRGRQPAAWTALQERVMRRDQGWGDSVRRYLALYRSLCA